MKKILSFTITSIFLFSSIWVSAALDAPKKTYYWNFVWELKSQDYPKKTIFLLQDEGWSVFRVFSSALASKIRDLFFRWARVKVEWQEYYAKNWFFAWIFLNDIENTEKKQEFSTIKQVQSLSMTKRIIAYVYSKFEPADSLNKLSWIFGWNNVSIVADEVWTEFANSEIDYNLYSFIKSLFIDKELSKNSNEYCLLSNWKKVYENLNPNLKSLIESLSMSELDDVIIWNNLDSPEKIFAREQLKNFTALNKYLSLLGDINFLKEELWGFWILSHQIDIISSIVWIEMSIDKLRFLVLNDFYLTSIVWALDDLSWISSNSFFNYVLSKTKNNALSVYWDECSFDDWVLEKLNNRIDKTDFDWLVQDAYSRDVSIVSFDWIKIINFDNFKTMVLDKNWEKFIRVFPWNYNPYLSIHINLKNASDSFDWETCTKTWDIRFSWINWWQFICNQQYNSLTKQWYFWDKIVRELYKDWKVFEIFYYVTWTQLDNLFEEIISKMEINN